VIVASVLEGKRFRAVPSGHNVFVERHSDNKMVSIPSRGEVRPGEAIRISVHGTGKMSSRQSEISFVDGYTGRVYDTKQITSNLAGNAWWDTKAPAQSGPVVITAATRHGSGIFGGMDTHSATTSMTVAGDAPPPPRPSRANTQQGFWVGPIGQFISAPFRWVGRTAKGRSTFAKFRPRSVIRRRQ